MPTQNTTSTTRVGNLDIEILERGAGAPLLFLHPESGMRTSLPCIDQLAKSFRVIAPCHPGFEHSPAVPGFDTVDDLSYFYLDLLKELNLNDVIVVGVSIGAWIAAEIAVKTTARIRALILADAIGIKISDRETRDIVDIFAITDETFRSMAYADPSAALLDCSTLSDAEVLAIARNREATARYAWSPYMHNPKLKARLRRIDVPTLALWGSSDRITPPAYGRAFAQAIPGASFEMIDKAGHFPHIEQPSEFSRRVLAFASASAPATQMRS